MCVFITVLNICYLVDFSPIQPYAFTYWTIIDINSYFCINCISAEQLGHRNILFSFNSKNRYIILIKKTDFILSVLSFFCCYIVTIVTIIDILHHLMSTKIINCKVLICHATGFFVTYIALPNWIIFLVSRSLLNSTSRKKVSTTTSRNSYLNLR